MMDDLDRIMAVMEAAFEPHWGEAWTRRQVADSLAFPSTHYTLVNAAGAAPAEGEPAAGFALVRAAPGEEELLLIGVVPELRGHGLGAQLLRLVAHRARERGADTLFLEMRQNNPAISLYRAFGFQPIGQRENYYKVSDGSRINAITMAYQLRSPEAEQ